MEIKKWDGRSVNFKKPYILEHELNGASVSKIWDILNIAHKHPEQIFYIKTPKSENIRELFWDTCSISIHEAIPNLGLNSLPSYDLEVINEKRKGKLTEIKIELDRILKPDGRNFHLAAELFKTYKPEYILPALKEIVYTDTIPQVRTRAIQYLRGILKSKLDLSAYVDKTHIRNIKRRKVIDGLNFKI